MVVLFNQWKWYALFPWIYNSLPLKYVCMIMFPCLVHSTQPKTGWNIICAMIWMHDAQIESCASSLIATWCRGLSCIVMPDAQHRAINWCLHAQHCNRLDIMATTRTIQNHCIYIDIGWEGSQTHTHRIPGGWYKSHNLVTRWYSSHTLHGIIGRADNVISNIRLCYVTALCHMEPYWYLIQSITA